MFCSNCGAENSASAGFCIQCGQSLGSVAAASVPAPPVVPVAPAPPAPAAAPTLAKLLGVSGPAIEWGAGAAFLAASILADLVFLFMPLLRGSSALGVYGLVESIAADLILTAVAVAAFRLVRNDAGAAALAAVGYTILHSALRFTLFQFLLHTPQGPPVFILFSLIGNFLFLLILSLAVRWIRPTWLGLWAGATAAQLAASLVYRVGSFLSSRVFGQYSYPLSFGPWDVVQVLLFAAVFAFAFWGGLTLFAPKVLRD
jgi:hypothetical protein